MPEFWKTFSYEQTIGLIRELAEGFVAGAFDRIDVLYSRFVSVISQKPTLLQLVPIVRPKKEKIVGVEQIYEPERNRILSELLPRAVETRFFVATLFGCGCGKTTKSKNYCSLIGCGSAR